MFEKEKQELIKYGKIAGTKNMTPGISGNISCRCGDNIIISATNTSNGYLELEDLVVIDFEKNIIEGCKKPSSEALLHIEYYKQRPDINSIFHFHCPYLTAYAAASLELDDMVLPEIIYCFNKIPLAKYAIPGSKELVEKTSVYFKDYDVILMENHGVISAGKNIQDAYLKLELCEAYAQTMIYSKILGGAKILQDEEVEKINLLKKIV